MESIQIQKFLNIKKSEIELGEFTLLIGPQASGKSIIAKLIYFFKDIPSIIFSVINDDGTKRDIDKKILSVFSEIFPKYTWEKSLFAVTYKYNAYYVKVYTTGSKNKKKLCISYSHEINELIQSTRSFYRKVKQQASSTYDNTEQLFWEKDRYIHKEINNFLSHVDLYFNQDVENPVFIPSGRSFFSTLQRNVFTFLSNNLNIDYFLKEFGSKYDMVKSFNRMSATKNKDTFKNIKELAETVLKGSYVQKGNKEFIKSSINGSLTSVENTSSGQQEALPMLLVLMTLPLFDEGSKNSYFVEEPEAHLFPESQKTVIELIAKIFNSNQGKCQYIITTHSPYVLSTLNVLLKADKLATYFETNNLSEKKSKLDKIIPPDTRLSSSSTKAYEVTNGAINSIIDEETQLIDDDIIDKVSSQNAFSFDEMLELEID